MCHHPRPRPHSTDDDGGRRHMKRSPAVLGVSAFALCVAAIPVSAAVTSEDSPAAIGSASEGTQTVERASAPSEASLVGTGAAFLLLGIGTVGIAHRRRWRTIDVRDGARDVQGATRPARA